MIHPARKQVDVVMHTSLDDEHETAETGARTSGSGGPRVSRRTVLRGIGGSIALTGASSAGLLAGSAAPASAASVSVGGGPAVDPLPTGHRRRRDHRVERKIRRLLSRMTLEEKLGQLQMPLGYGGVTPELEAAARSGRIGAMLGLFGAAQTNRLQRVAVNESRLGIPLMMGLDVIHGYLTNFPIPLAQGSSFDPSTAATDARVSAKEARSSGVNWTYAPMMDVCHEPRWGRIIEGNGEDPYLTSAFAVAKTRGFQGNDYSGPDRLAACAKHFVAYGQPEGGRDYNTVDMSEQRLRNMYLPPFMAAVEAGVATVMASFNTLNGVPNHANPHTLTEILKEEWDFDGFVTSDYTGIHELIAHGAAADGAQAAQRAVDAGIDMEMVSTDVLDNGAELVRSGRIPMSRLDDAVTRILRVKFRLGLFDHPYVDESKEITAPSAEARAAARDVADRSMVLVKNDGAVLPLARTLGSIAVVGPFADNTDLQGATPGLASAPFPSVTVLAGIQAAVPSAHVTSVRGVDPNGTDTSGIPDAVAAARAADLTVVVVGEPSALSGEASSRSDITLPGSQEELVSAIAATGKPFVVVLTNGRPLDISSWAASAPAILIAWHGGLEAGNAIADVLFGAVNPGGKLPVSFPRSVGQLPWYYNHENTGRPYDPNNKYTSKYLDLPYGPLFEFGFGLSYTSFDISGLTLNGSSFALADLRSKRAAVTATATVRNTGSRSGDEVVQLYVHEPVATIVRPVRVLRGFRRVTLDAGASTTVTFRLTADDLGYWTNDARGRFVVEPGDFEVYVGNSSSAALKATFTVT